ncbi:MAG: hypothetical protein AAGB10_14365 [Pseudomonadota bacterium]
MKVQKLFNLRLLSLALATTLLGQAATAACHPRLTGEFAQAMREAGRTGDFRAPTEKFGRRYEALIGLPCDPEDLQAALEAQGWEKFGIREFVSTEANTVRVSLNMRWRRRGLMGFLVGGNSAGVEVIFEDGETVKFGALPRK